MQLNACQTSHIQLQSQINMRPQTVILTFIALIVLPPPAVAGDESSLKPGTELVAIRDAALADDYAYQQVAHLTDNIGPRAAGSPQAA